MVIAVAVGKLDSRLGKQRLSPALLTQAQQMGTARAKSFLAVRALLAELMYAVFNQPILPEIVALSGGKPVFAEAGYPFFSLSHSKDRLLVVVSDLASVGCDIELNRERRSMAAIAQAYFSAEENNWLSEQPNFQKAFWQLWCQREALLKQAGQGVWRMNAVALDPIRRTFSAPFAASRLCHAEVDGCQMALAVAEGEIQHWKFTQTAARLESATAPDWQHFYPQSGNVEQGL